MTIRNLGVTVVGLFLIACGDSVDSGGQGHDERLISAAESFIDAFYNDASFLPKADFRASPFTPRKGQAIT